MKNKKYLPDQDVDYLNSKIDDVEKELHIIRK
jgi:hypothetical protein